MSDTEEPVRIRPRPFRNRIFQVMLVIVGLQGLYFTVQSQSTPLNEWPADLADRSGFCRLNNYRSCRDGDWFGIQKSQVAEKTGILAAVCQNWTDKPDAAQVRMIEAADGDTLYLCKMKDPAKIDPGKARL